jgi:hypothetical protein
MIGKLRGYLARKGLTNAILGVARTLMRPVIRIERHGVWETMLLDERPPSAWANDEEFRIVGPETLEGELNPRLVEFLGGENAAYDLEGVRRGDRLLIVTINGQYVYGGYVYFNTTEETRRQLKIYGEDGTSPVIGTCVSKPVRVWSRAPGELSESSGMFGMLRRLLPATIDIRHATEGFSNVGSLVYTAQLAHDLGIPFERLKALVVGGKSLRESIETLRPDVDAALEVRRVWNVASIHRRVLNEVFRYLRTHGHRRVINDVLDGNLPSQNANVDLGMTMCRELSDWTICRTLVVQRVSGNGRSRWRAFRR